MESRIFLRGILPSKFQNHTLATWMLGQESGHIPDYVVYRYPAGISSVVLG